jgi:Putative Ig domain.
MNLPEGADFDQSTGVFTWTPSTAHTGISVKPVFYVTDGDISSSTSASINVTS